MLAFRPPAACAALNTGATAPAAAAPNPATPNPIVAMMGDRTTPAPISAPIPDTPDRPGSPTALVALTLFADSPSSLASRAEISRDAFAAPSMVMSGVTLRPVTISLRSSSSSWASASLFPARSTRACARLFCTWSSRFARPRTSSDAAAAALPAARKPFDAWSSARMLKRSSCRSATAAPHVFFCRYRMR